MTNPPPSTMVPPRAANLSRIDQTVRTTPNNPKEQPTTKNSVMQEFDLTICDFFPTPMAPAKFHPITAMLKDKSSLASSYNCQQ